MAHLDELAIKLISDVKTALVRAVPDLATNGLKIDSVKLDLKVTAKVDPGFKVTLFNIVTIGAKHEHSEIQTITVKLGPPKEADADSLLPSISDALVQAIVVISAAAKEAAEQPPILELGEAEVALEIGVTNGGSVEVFVAISGEKEETHTLTIGLKPVSAD